MARVGTLRVCLVVAMGVLELGACGGRTTLDEGFAFAGGSAVGSAGSVASAGSAGSAGSGAGGEVAVPSGGTAGVAGSAGGSDPVGTAGGFVMPSTPPSCSDLPSDCGPGRNEDCCDSRFVSGGSYNRNNDAAWPATVSSFRLDRFEVTVGRFRQFVAAYTQDMIPNGAGKNPNNPKDPGWDAKRWNQKLPPDNKKLSDELALKASRHTWTKKPAADSEHLAMNNMSWYEAEAFCIWDGGRLPTAAEWNYAAEGGDEQRAYPWSRPATSTKIDRSYAVYADEKSDVSTLVVQRVGSTSPEGDGKYGQADLGGNVAELIQDFVEPEQGYPHSKVCTDCAYLTDPIADDARDAFGGNYESSSDDLLNVITDGEPSGMFPDVGFSTWGLRCARAAESGL